MWFKRLYHTRRDLNKNANHAWRTTHWDQNKRRKCGRSFPTVFPRHDINFDSISCLDQNTCFARKLVWFVKSLLHHTWCDWFKFRNITPKCIVQWNLVWFVKNMLHHTWCDWLKLRNITPDFIFVWNLLWLVKILLHHTWCDWLKFRNITPDFIFWEIWCDWLKFCYITPGVIG